MATNILGGGNGTGTTPYAGPMSGNAFAQPPSLSQLAPNQELVMGPDGWVVRANSNPVDNKPFVLTDNTSTRNPLDTGYQTRQPVNQRERLLGTSGLDPFKRVQNTLVPGLYPEMEQDNTGTDTANQGVTSTTTPTTTAGTTEQETPPPPPPQRERLLGTEGVQPYNQAQQQLLDRISSLEEIIQQQQQQQAPAPAPEPAPAAAPVTPVTPTTFSSLGQQTPVGTTGAATAGQAAQAQVQQAAPIEKPDLATVEAALASDEIKSYLAEFRAANGQVAANDLVQAAIQDPNTLSQLQLQAAQIAEARRVEPVGDRTLQEGEMITGTGVEQQKVEDLVSDIKAETAEPSELATVQGQLAKLTADFDTKNPPAWAAGALRNATAQLAARGLAASSMAGQALIQATFEAATPIAAADAATVAQFEQQNLSNRQQSAMLAAQQRAAFLGQEFDQAFQTKVQNATKIFEIANMNYNADVQIALENARIAQSVDIANLNAANAKILADSAAMTNMDLTNLNNRQQAAVANAQSFMSMNLANLNNNQQAEVIKAQGVINSMLSDQAAENVARNLNTTNENQLNQFFAQIESNVAQFNAAQANAIAQSNVSEVNAIQRFNAEQSNNVKISYDRNQATISSARISANASIESSKLSAEASKAAAASSAAATQAAASIRAEADLAMQAAANELKMTTLEMEQQYQRESDLLAMEYDTMTRNSDKAFELFKLDMSGQIELEAAKWAANEAEDASFKKNIIDLGLNFVGSLFD